MSVLSNSSQNPSVHKKPLIDVADDDASMRMAHAGLLCSVRMEAVADLIRKSESLGIKPQ